MSIYIGSDLEDRLKILETENALLKNLPPFKKLPSGGA